tara:strand:+ start:89 stop:643 length:555 start_codon:yes stop_codon:yes gene_type:complete
LIDLSKYAPSTWPPHLAPIGEGFQKEPFITWWLRNRQELQHLDKRICEQWIYRHWGYTDFDFLELERLSYKSIFLSAQEIVYSVAYDRGVTLTPETDRYVFERSAAGIPIAPATAFQRLNTWDYPIITLEAAGGYIGRRASSLEPSLVLIEGHQRFRYLTSLVHHYDAPEGPHEVFVLKTDQAL